MAMTINVKGQEKVAFLRFLQQKKKEDDN